MAACGLRYMDSAMLSGRLSNIAEADVSGRGAAAFRRVDGRKRACSASKTRTSALAADCVLLTAYGHPTAPVRRACIYSRTCCGRRGGVRDGASSRHGPRHC